jgi:hypothetical protein
VSEYKRRTKNRPRHHGTAQAVSLVAESKEADQKGNRLRIGSWAACSRWFAEARRVFGGCGILVDRQYIDNSGAGSVDLSVNIGVP